MESDLRPHRETLLVLTKRDADPTVRHRAHALLTLLDMGSARVAAALLDVSPKTLGRWRARFVAEGRDGLGDRPRRGRPPKLDAAARALLAEALEADPGAYGYPVATWTIADLTDLLARRGWVVSAVTVNRAVHALGYVHRRPRHDLRHRQDVEAVASARRVLDELQKRGPIRPAASASSTWTSASFTPTPTWQRAGNAGASPDASRRPGPTSA
jgi:transposase